MSTDFANVNAAGFTVEGTFVPDKLFPRDVVSRIGTIKQSAALVRGSLLGKITKGAATAAPKAGGNTGNGTFVIDATTPTLANARVGVYSLRCIEAVTNGGKFTLFDPLGRSLGQHIVVAGAGGTIAVSDQVKGVLTDGSTDFVVGDGFDITVPAGSGKYVLAASAALDGSDDPDAVLLEPADASAADASAAIAIAGKFGTQGITFGTGVTASSADAVLRTKNIFLENVIG